MVTSWRSHIESCSLKWEILKSTFLPCLLVWVQGCKFENERLFVDFAILTGLAQPNKKLFCPTVHRKKLQPYHFPSYNSLEYINYQQDFTGKLNNLIKWMRWSPILRVYNSFYQLMPLTRYQTNRWSVPIKYLCTYQRFEDTAATNETECLKPFNRKKDRNIANILQVISSDFYHLETTQRAGICLKKMAVCFRWRASKRIGPWS